ncbi:MAG: GGDEF domain-containing protein [Betaproteobacteria bacterium]|nr:GGDEF domain-containing protein [Betaproteobacteria bacterium]
MLEFLFSRLTIRRFFPAIGAAFAVLLAAVGALAAYLFFAVPGMDAAASAAFAVLAALLLLLAALVVILLVYANKKLLAPIEKLTDDIENIQNTLPAQKRIFHDDEIVFLTKQFYAMKERMDNSYRNLEEISFTDSLTGLYNRHYFFQVARPQVQIAIRNRHPICVIIGDVDHFKSVNDTHGHLIGDEALKHAANLVRGSVRESDICARFGGEEFIVLLNNSNLDNSMSIGEKIRAAMEKSPCKTDATTLRLTISIGVAEVNAKTGDINESINRADHALYDAKNGGRNMVCAAPLQTP